MDDFNRRVILWMLAIFLIVFIVIRMTIFKTALGAQESIPPAPSK